MDDDENEPPQPPIVAVKPSTSQGNKRRRVENTFNWTKDDLPPDDPFLQTRGNFSPRTSEEVLSPLQYFLNFFCMDVIENIVQQTNLYSTQQRGTSIATNNKEITDFLSIILMMGVLHLPSYEDYWSGGTRVPTIADVMPIKRFKLLRRFIHFNNNELITENTKDRYFKVRPLIEQIRANCQKFHLENDFSIDETMVAYKGTRAGNLRQYIKNKPYKWGYKFFVIAGVSGIILDFIPYQGSATFTELKGTKHELTEHELSLGVGASVVIALCKSVPDPVNSVVYFDNYFSGLPLFTYLKQNLNIRSLGTLRSNRIAGCPIEVDKVLIKQGRGTFDYKSDIIQGITVIKWVDNKCVLLGSTIYGVNPTSNLKRFSKPAGKKIDIVCPNVVSKYNKHMGGVDKANALMGLYKTPSKAKRWYFAIFTYLLDISVVNAWIVYRQDCSALNQKYKPLKHFRLEIIQSLAQTGKTPKKGRPSVENNTKIKYPVVVRPDNLTRKDCYGHWPIHTTKGRCRNCTNGTTRLKCIKCDSRLCLTETKNCFYDFHQ